MEKCIYYFDCLIYNFENKKWIIPQKHNCPQWLSYPCLKPITGNNNKKTSKFVKKKNKDKSLIKNRQLFYQQLFPLPQQLFDIYFSQLEQQINKQEFNQININNFLYNIANYKIKKIPFPKLCFLDSFHISNFDHLIINYLLPNEKMYQTFPTDLIGLIAKYASIKNVNSCHVTINLKKGFELPLSLHMKNQGAKLYGFYGTKETQRALNKSLIFKFTQSEVNICTLLENENTNKNKNENDKKTAAVRSRKGGKNKNKNKNKNKKPTTITSINGGKNKMIVLKNENLTTEVRKYVFKWDGCDNFAMLRFGILWHSGARCHTIGIKILCQKTDKNNDNEENEESVDNCKKQQHQQKQEIEEKDGKLKQQQTEMSEMSEQKVDLEKSESNTMTDNIDHSYSNGKNRRKNQYRKTKRKKKNQIQHKDNNDHDNNKAAIAGITTGKVTATTTAVKNVSHNHNLNKSMKKQELDKQNTWGGTTSNMTPYQRLVYLGMIKKEDKWRIPSGVHTTNKKLSHQDQYIFYQIKDHIVTKDDSIVMNLIYCPIGNVLSLSFTRNNSNCNLMSGDRALSSAVKTFPPHLYNTDRQMYVSENGIIHIQHAPHMISQRMRKSGKIRARIVPFVQCYPIEPVKSKTGCQIKFQLYDFNSM